VPIGQPVYAPAAGKVVKVKSQSTGYGRHVVIEDLKGNTVIYGHLDSFGVREGDIVNKGAVLGRTGNTGNSTGPHLHFEVRQDNNPVNPWSYLNSAPKNLPYAPAPKFPYSTDTKTAAPKNQYSTVINTPTKKTAQTKTAEPKKSSNDAGYYSTSDYEGKEKTRLFATPFGDVTIGAKLENVFAVISGVIILAIGVSSVARESAKSPAVKRSKETLTKVVTAVATRGTSLIPEAVEAVS